MSDGRGGAAKPWLALTAVGILSLAILVFWIMFTTATPETPRARNIADFLIQASSGIVVVGAIGAWWFRRR